MQKSKATKIGGDTALLYLCPFPRLDKHILLYPRALLMSQNRPWWCLIPSSVDCISLSHSPIMDIWGVTDNSVDILN